MRLNLRNKSKCPYCRKGFNTFSQLGIHCRMAHKEEVARNKSIAKHLYDVDEVPTYIIAKKLGVATGTVARWLLEI